MYYFKWYLQIVILYVTFLSYISLAQAEGIVCYKCFITPTNPDDTNLLCSHFKESSKFQAYCPTSTLCMKKTIQYKSKTSVVTTVLRDCASQKYTSHLYNATDRMWHQKEEVITTAYEEGCFIGEHRGAPTGPPEYCFCSSHLCNSSPIHIGMFSKIYGTIFAFLIVKFL